jgi:hypothetical protein
VKSILKAQNGSNAMQKKRNVKEQARPFTPRQIEALRWETPPGNDSPDGSETHAAAKSETHERSAAVNTSKQARSGGMKRLNETKHKRSTIA